MSPGSPAIDKIQSSIVSTELLLPNVKVAKISNNVNREIDRKRSSTVECEMIDLECCQKHTIYYLCRLVLAPVGRAARNNAGTINWTRDGREACGSNTAAPTFRVITNVRGNSGRGFRILAWPLAMRSS